MFVGFPELNKILRLAVGRDWSYEATHAEVVHLELICLIVWVKVMISRQQDTWR